MAMRFAGKIHGEETVSCPFKGGRIFVEALIYERAEDWQRDDPRYWEMRIESGEFDSEDGPPLAWRQA